MRTSLPSLALVLALSIGCKGKQETAAPPAVGQGPAGTVGAATRPAAAAAGAGPAVDGASTDAGEHKVQLAEGPADSLFFALERTPCFGRCPTYKVRITNDGRATYKGIRSVAREGDFTGTVDRATMDALYARALSIGFFGLKDRYDSDVTDLPSTIIRIRANGQDKQVVGRVGSPQAFKAFATYADSLFEQVRWTEVPKEK